MGITRERFAQGMTYEQYYAQMTRNQERFKQQEEQVTITTADLAPFAALPRPLRVLVLAEDWCGDVINGLPILGRIAAATDKLELRVFLRDQNLDLMDQYLKEGKYRSIPVFAFFDDEFNQVGLFIERPAATTARYQRQREELTAQHPEFGSPETPITQLDEAVRTQLMTAMAAQRESARAEDNQEIIRALQAIASAANGHASLG